MKKNLALFDKKAKGSYTVEATVVISLCMILFGSAVIISYELFKYVLDYVTYKPDSFDSVKLFRLEEGVMGVYHAIID